MNSCDSAGLNSERSAAQQNRYLIRQRTSSCVGCAHSGPKKKICQDLAHATSRAAVEERIRRMDGRGALLLPERRVITGRRRLKDEPHRQQTRQTIEGKIAAHLAITRSAGDFRIRKRKDCMQAGTRELADKCTFNTILSMYFKRST